MNSASNTVENSNYSSKDFTIVKYPKNVLWLRTIYEDIISNPDLITENPLKGTEVKCPVLNAIFYLEVKKTSHSILSVSCNRKFLSSHTSTDEGYFLRFYFTITGVHHKTISAVMRSNENSVTVDYMTHEFSDSPSEKYYVCTIKCVVRMIETSKLLELDELEQELQKHSKKFSKSQLRHMAYLLKRPKLRGIFTGRENVDIVLTKLSYIDRAFPYIKQLAKYMRSKEESDPYMTELPLGTILCQISCGCTRNITEEECITLFLNSIRVGLHFLYVIVSDYIISNLNKDYVVDVLKAADSVNDRRLFKSAADFFLANRREILQSEKWKILAHSSANSYARSIIHNIKLGQTLDDSYLAPGLFEETAEY